MFTLGARLAADFSVHFAVMEADRGTKVEDLERMSEDVRSRLRTPGASIEIAALDEQQEQLAASKLEPTDEGWSCWTWRTQRGTGEGSTREYPELDTMLPGRCRTLVIRAEGYAEQKLALDPAAKNGGVPRLVLLAR